MIVTVNGVSLERWNYVPVNEKEINIENNLDKYFIPAAVIVGIMNVANNVNAYSGNMEEASKPLIRMVQDFAFPVGVIMATWGLIEMIIGNPSGKEKTKWAIIGYVGIFVIPMVFSQIRAAFQ